MLRKSARWVAFLLLPGCSLVVGFGDLTGGHSGAPDASTPSDGAVGASSSDGSVSGSDGEVSTSTDASTRDASQSAKDAGITCMSSCSCSGSDSCTFVGGNGSIITCNNNSDCHVTCPAGPCFVSCGGNADCYVTGPNVMCMTVSQNATCHVM